MPTITIRVSDDEREKIDAAAADSGRTISGYVRDQVLNDKRADELGDVLTKLNQRVGRLERSLTKLKAEPKANDAA